MKNKQFYWTELLEQPCGYLRDVKYLNYAYYGKCAITKKNCDNAHSELEQVVDCEHKLRNLGG